LVITSVHIIYDQKSYREVSRSDLMKRKKGSYLATTEGAVLNQVRQTKVVDDAHARDDSLAKTVGTSEVLGEDGCAKTVFSAVDPLEQLFFSLPRDNRHDRAEALIGNNLHFVIDVDQDGRLVEQTTLVVIVSLATRSNFSALGNSVVDEALNLFELE
jgi:hypothetical protein